MKTYEQISPRHSVPPYPTPLHPTPFHSILRHTPLPHPLHAMDQSLFDVTSPSAHGGVSPLMWSDDNITHSPCVQDCDQQS
jgi:hypothetical protein